MKYLAPILLIVLSSCGRPAIVDAELKPFVDSFITLSRQYNPELDLPDEVYFDVVFVPSLKYPIIGSCGNGKISISRLYWDTASFFNREQLMFHELGHCFLGKSHTNTASIMYPWMLPEFYYLTNKHALLIELFKSPQQVIHVTPGSCEEYHEMP